MTRYDALLLVSFGGPEKRDDVIPFLENVLRGRNVPHERLLAVAEHYYHFDGRSPINGQCRALIAALDSQGVELPIYWGNRNWHPMLGDTISQMRADGVRRALAIATSAFGSYSGCRQYREDIESARASVEGAPSIDKLPPFWNNAGFLAAMVERVRDALTSLPDAEIVYTAHSIPVSMAQSSPYEQPLREAARHVSAELGLGEPVLVFQSRSGPPSQPWLGPDIGEYIQSTAAKRLIAVPIGFISDHMEVIYDLDYKAARLAASRGIQFGRAGTVGTHPLFVAGLIELVREAQANGIKACMPDCCPPPAGRGPVQTR
ncbi:MAG TPA: ferrochelatase [Bryobacteraceae bacterium]|jgi:ferrochelatase|nr:ferrochelatase [Bryobacteraceae bacterium]